MGYQDPPWVFKGRAIYQLHLVKVEKVLISFYAGCSHTSTTEPPMSAPGETIIPDHMKIASLFGYTLGGLYLARYSDSPAGAFDEVVVLAGLVWNFPTSCAWAARVYVNNRDARNHGRTAIGLPSCHASFGMPTSSGSITGDAPASSWWSPCAGLTSTTSAPEPCSVELRNLERKRWWHRRPPAYAREEGMVCCMGLSPPSTGWQGPHLSLSLPSFSGGTPMVPELLQYACRLSARIRPVKPIQIVAPAPLGQEEEEHEEALHALLTSRPVVALAFCDMVMHVRAPVLLRQQEAELRRQIETPMPAFATMTSR